jgi:hypothetical protein
MTGLSSQLGDSECAFLSPYQKNEIATESTGLDAETACIDIGSCWRSSLVYRRAANSPTSVVRGTYPE